MKPNDEGAGHCRVCGDVLSGRLSVCPVCETPHHLTGRLPDEVFDLVEPWIDREPASAPSARTLATAAQGRRLAEFLGLPFEEFRT